MDRMNVLEYRRNNAAQALREHNLRAALICNPRREDMERWLLDEVPLPGLAPFGTLNMLLVTDDAQVKPFSAAVNHPCDFPHFPLFDVEALAGLVPDLRVGIVNGEFLLQSTYEALNTRYPGLKFVDISSQMYLAKARKNDDEVAAIRRSTVLYHRVLRTVPVILRQDITEMDAAVDLRHRLALSGADVDFLAEDPMLSSLVTLTSAPDGGESAQEPMLYPGRRITCGDRVNVSMKGVMPESCAAIGRSFVLGEACRQSREFWTLAVQAQSMAASLVRPGVTLRSVYEQVNSFLTSRGCLPDHSCWIHGIGCSPCEAPRCVDASADMPLEANMTLVIAPRVLLPETDPYCCMDTFVVTEDGCKPLYPADQSLREI